MRKVGIFFVLFLLFSMALGQVAFADNCDLLSGKSFCVSFKYSEGLNNSFTAVFDAGHFNLGGNSPGTYTCKGKNFVEVNYLFGGFESQVWYAEAKLSGTRLFGHGKSLTNGYLYNLRGAEGACTTGIMGGPGWAQDEYQMRP